ncbi:FAD-dependent monooxygenase [Crossiella sp. CA-258035]|uniref:FAD-dependent monooxygenase n=1 Tax=Crossiella sp. CA-258035 TaxID=2981138 RepID=UPI0024BC2A2E|nr:FAD-dependent monooxygenase [Crossiella sp. CA-258035]WHT23325.1 FAD-dependent monooxygenase [Crossiella sp. CA-258035]
MTDADVVVVGGGPVGLMTACELALGGVRPVILERLAEPTGHDRAGVLHTRTVETLAARGLFARFREGNDITEGLPFAGIFSTGIVHEHLDTRHKFSLLVPQSQTERLLTDRAAELGVEIRRGHEVTGLAQNADEVTAEVTGPDGTYQFRGRYLVGCDGGRSSVRRLADMGFRGVEASVSALIGYATCQEKNLPMKWERAKGGIIVLGFPPEGGIGRVVTMEYNRPDVDRDAPATLTELREAVHRVTGREVPLTEPVLWLSRFSDRSGHAEHYRRGRVFVAGDASHVHFPIGGQGLNTGLQDAVNLGWKLAGRIHGWASEAVLDSYQRERQPVAQRVLMNTRAQLALMNPDEQHTTPLRTLVEELLGIEEVNRHLIAMITGTDIRYDLGETAPDHPLAGRFAPDLPLKTADGEVLVSRLLSSGRGVLLDLAGREDLRPLAQDRQDRVEVVAAHTDEPAPAAALLIRPDGYCAWATDSRERSVDDRDALREAIVHWFG